MMYPNDTPQTAFAESHGLLFIWQVPGSNAGPEIYYSYQGFLWFSSVLPSKCRDSASYYDTAVSFHILSNSLLINHPIIRQHILTSSLNRQQSKT
jgi:hypothetical protein